jgi:hypothetical protein
MLERVARILDAARRGRMPANPYQAPEADLDDAPRALEGAEELESLREILVPLKATRPWVKLVSVAGFVGAVLLVILGAITFFSEVKNATLMAVVYVLIGAVYVVPSLHLSRFASSIQELLRSRETPTLVRALEHQQKFWHFTGVLTLLVLALYAIGFLAVIVMVLSKPHL